MHVISERIEPFGWVYGLIYTYPHWLLDVIFYQIHNIFSFEGIYAFTILSGILIYFLIYHTNKKVAKNHIISGIITIASIYMLSGFIAARAQVITFICLILEILFIERYLETGKKRYLIGLIIDPILLANCHAALFPIYFVIFMPYLAEYLIALFIQRKTYRIKHIEKKISKLEQTDNCQKEISEISNQKIQKLKKKLEKIKEEQKISEEKRKEKQQNTKIIIEKNPKMKWLCLIFIICIFTGLVTPIKDIPYTYMIKSIEGNTMNYISEHQPVVLIHDLPLLVILTITAFLLFTNKTKITLRDTFMLVGMTILAIISYKQLPIFIISTMCIINKLALMYIQQTKKNKETNTPPEITESTDTIAIPTNNKFTENEKNDVIEADTKQPQETKPKIPPKPTLKQKLKTIPNKLLTIKGMIYITLVIIIFALLSFRNIVVQDYVDKTNYPIEAAEWIKENLNLEEIRLFNDFNYGSYLLYQDIPVFIDGRADVYDPKFNGKEDDSFLAYMLSTSGQVWYEDVFYNYDITHIITYTASNLNQLIERNENYEMLYQDNNFAIYKIHSKEE